MRVCSLVWVCVVPVFAWVFGDAAGSVGCSLVRSEVTLHAMSAAVTPRVGVWSERCEDGGGCKAQPNATHPSLLRGFRGSELSPPARPESWGRRGAGGGGGAGGGDQGAKETVHTDRGNKSTFLTGGGSLGARIPSVFPLTAFDFSLSLCSAT